MANGNNIIFTKEDKREAVTITDVEDYVKETEEQLNINTYTYKISQLILVCFENDELIT